MNLSRFLLIAAALTLAQAASADLKLVIQPTDDSSQQIAHTLDSNNHIELALEKNTYQVHIDNEARCEFPLGHTDGEKTRFNKPIALTECALAPIELKIRVAGTVLFRVDPTAKTLTLSLKPKKTVAKPFVRPLPDIACSSWDGNPVSVNVSSVFSEGEWIRDFYSQQTAQVINGIVTLTPAIGSNGLLLIESVDAPTSRFTWDNATVYFVMTDRFNNGDTTNDHSFGRKKDGKDEIGTFHGGDIRGLIDKLDYIDNLGANAIWMTPLVEQVHGFVGGGKNGDFPFYAYHGYWALDYTKLDPNFGTDDDLRELVKEAHSRGIRLIWDAVINHVGYATGQDITDFDIDVFKPNQQIDNDWTPQAGQTWHSYHDAIDYNSGNWNTDWWNNQWVRTGLPGYETGKGDDLTKPLAGLPDFLTESTKPVNLPPILLNKPNTQAKAVEKPVIDHLIDWQTYWLRNFGIDGFRADTVKHVELEEWQKLKDASLLALEQWKQENPEQALDDLPFWLVGEYFNHGMYRDYHYDFGFDSLINFEFQDKAHDLAMCMNDIESIYADYAENINTDSSFNGLTYLSSHDTTLFYAKFKSLELQKRVAAPFLLLPGGVQIYYGDETGRGLGPYGDDFHQGTRSDMNWSNTSGVNQQLLEHWQKIGQFRRKHAAIGAGKHTKLSDSPYIFSRIWEQDKVVIVFAGNEAL